MKYLILILTLPLWAQWGGVDAASHWNGESPRWGGNITAFNPVDANTVVLWSGDTNITTAGGDVELWIDQVEDDSLKQTVSGDRPTHSVANKELDFIAAQTDFLEINNADINAGLDPGTGDYTIEFYVTWELEDSAPIEHNDVDNATVKGYRVDYQNTNPDSLVVLVSDGSGTYWVEQKIAIASASKVFISITLDRDGSQKGYKNAVEQWTQSTSNSVNIVTSSSFFVGKTRVGLAGSTQYFDGKIYEIRMSNKPRSAMEISNYYTYLQTKYGS